MIKELMHDPIFLAGKSEVATKEDLQVAVDKGRGATADIGVIQRVSGNAACGTGS